MDLPSAVLLLFRALANNCAGFRAKKGNDDPEHLPAGAKTIGLMDQRGTVPFAGRSRRSRKPMVMLRLPAVPQDLGTACLHHRSNDQKYPDQGRRWDQGER
jgi:hypothetical protein